MSTVANRIAAFKRDGYLVWRAIRPMVCYGEER